MAGESKKIKPPLGIIEDWYEFQDAEYLSIARDWLKENNLTNRKI